MDPMLAERIAVVETKVGALEAMSDKVDTIYDYIVAEKANRRLRTRFFAGIAGFVTVCGGIWELVGPLTKKG